MGVSSPLRPASPGTESCRGKPSVLRGEWGEEMGRASVASVMHPQPILAIAPDWAERDKETCRGSVNH